MHGGRGMQLCDMARPPPTCANVGRSSGLCAQHATARSNQRCGVSAGKVSRWPLVTIFTIAPCAMPAGRARGACMHAWGQGRAALLRCRGLLRRPTTLTGQ